MDNNNKTKKKGRIRLKNPFTEPEMAKIILTGNRIGKIIRASKANNPKSIAAAEVRRIAKNINKNTAAKRIGYLNKRTLKRGIIPRFLKKYEEEQKIIRNKNLRNFRKNKFNTYINKLTETELSEILHRQIEPGEVVEHAAEEAKIFRHWEKEEEEKEEERQKLYKQLAESTGRYGPGFNPSHLIFKGQELPVRVHLDANGLPPPAWFDRLITNIETARGFIESGIVPFELINSIRSQVCPTRDQLYKQRADRMQRRELNENAIHDMDELLKKLHRVAVQDPRYAEVQQYARVLSNYYVSEEAPARIETTAARVSPEQEDISLSQGDVSNNDRKTTQKRSGRDVDDEFRNLEPAQLQNVAQNIINMAGDADDILRGDYGINARFAIWSPYGPGAGARNLTRLFIIYDGVIEETAKAKLMNTSANVDLITALTILTDQAKDRTMVADAVAEVVVTGRQSSSVVEAIVLDQIPNQEWTPAFPGQVQWEPSRGFEGELLNIPIRDAYMAWEAALWTQSHLSHEAPIAPDILAAHCRMIEFTLGHSTSIGTQHRRCLPSFYQLNVEAPLRESYNIIANACSEAKNALSSAASSAASSIAASFCSMFRSSAGEGVRIEPVVEGRIPSPAQLDFFARLMSDTRASAVVRRSARASRAVAVDLGENAMALSSDVAEELREYGSAAASNLQNVGFNALSRVATSVDTGLDRFYDVAEELRENGINEIAINVTQAANRTSARAGDLRQHLTQVTMPQIAISSIEASSIVQILAGGGGSITVECNNNSIVNSPVVMTISPVVHMQGPVQITTADNQQVIVDAEPLAAAVEIMDIQPTSTALGKKCKGKKCKSSKKERRTGRTGRTGRTRNTGRTRRKGNKKRSKKRSRKGKK